MDETKMEVTLSTDRTKDGGAKNLQSAEEVTPPLLRDPDDQNLPDEIGRILSLRASRQTIQYFWHDIIAFVAVNLPTTCSFPLRSRV